MKKHDLVKQPNALTTAIYSFNRNQKRVFYTLLQSIASNGLNKVKSGYECKIDHRTYAELFETTNASREISAAFNEFESKGGANTITVVDHDESLGDDVGKTTIYIVVKSEHKPKSGYSSFQILHETYDLLRATDNKFTMFLLSYAGKLQNPYAMRLYETICQWKNTTNHRKLSCDWMREHYVMPKSYSLSSNFRHKFLLPAVKEISEKTNVVVTFKELYEGERKNSVSHIVFSWADKEKVAKKEKTLPFEPTLEQAVQTHSDLLDADTGKPRRLPSKEELDNLKAFLGDLVIDGFEWSEAHRNNFKLAQEQNS